MIRQFSDVKRNLPFGIQVFSSMMNSFLKVILLYLVALFKVSLELIQF